MNSDADLTPLQEAELKYLGAVLPSSLRNPQEDIGHDVSQVEVSPEGILDILSEEVSELVRQVDQPIAFKMSGGLDSRLLAYILKGVNDFSGIEAHLVCHPALEPDEDVDVVLAKKTLEHLGFRGEVKIQKGLPKDYLSPFDSESLQLSGIYGTEILGGLMFDVLPVVERLEDQSLEEYLNRVPQTFRPHIEKVTREFVLPGNTRFFCELFLNSPRSTIYGSVEGSWSQPKHLKEYCLAPFCSPAFIQKISLLEKQDLEHYNFYHKVFQLLPEAYRSIPLCSDYKRFQQHPFPAPEGLKNSKVIEGLTPPSPWA